MASQKDPRAVASAAGGPPLNEIDRPTVRQALGGIEAKPCPLAAQRRPGLLDHRSTARQWLRHRYRQLHGEPPYAELQRTSAGGIGWRPVYSHAELHRCIGLVEVSHG